jgi:hypothetical protein
VTTAHEVDDWWRLQQRGRWREAAANRGGGARGGDVKRREMRDGVR